MLGLPCTPGDPQRQARAAKNRNGRWLPQPRLLRHPCILGEKKKLEGNPCLLGGPKEGGNARSPLHSRGSPTPSAGSKKQKRSPTKGNKIRSGCLNPAFSGAQKRARLLRHPCILGDPQRQARGAKKISSCPQQRGTKSDVAASPLPSRGPKRAEMLPCNAKRGEQKIKNGLGGTKSEVAASTLPSRWPKRGQDCSVTPAFLGIPNAKRGHAKRGEQKKNEK